MFVQRSVGDKFKGAVSGLLKWMTGDAAKKANAEKAKRKARAAQKKAQLAAGNANGSSSQRDIGATGLLDADDDIDDDDDDDDGEEPAKEEYVPQVDIDEGEPRGARR